jgi:hypothetical protein
MELVEVSPPYDTSDITALMGTRVIVDVLGSLVAAGKWAPTSAISTNPFRSPMANLKESGGPMPHDIVGGHVGHHHHPHDHNHSHADHLHSHLTPEDEAADLQVLTAQFIDGFVAAKDKQAYLRLAGVPLERPGKSGCQCAEAGRCEADDRVAGRHGLPLLRHAGVELPAVSG